MTITTAQTIRASYGDVACFSLMVGLGESYIIAFALALGFREQSSGLLATLPILLAACLQLLAPLGVRFLGSQRRWVLSCCSLQSIALLGFAGIGAWAPQHSKSLEMMVFGCALLYWTSAMAAGPSWNSWITRLVPREAQFQFFAQRTKIAQVFTLVGLSVAGLWLHSLTATTTELPVFASLFLVAAIARGFSVYFLSRHPEVNLPRIHLSRLMLGRLLGDWLRERRTFIILLFLASTHFAVNISGPFFSAYMLKQLHLDYERFMILVSTAFITRIITNGWAHRIAQSFGATSLAHLGALLIVPSPILWIFSDNFYVLLLVQVYTGLAWGCHELGVTLMLIDKHTHEERARLLTISTLTNAAMMSLGASTGFALLSHGKLEAAHYHSLFSISTVLRLFPLLILSYLGDSRLPLRLWLREVKRRTLRVYR